MTKPLDPTVAARVPAELKTRAEALVEPGGRFPDKSSLIRRGLELVLLEHQHGGDLFAPRQGTTRRNDRETSQRAARTSTPRTGTQRHRALEIIAARGDHGSTTDEAIASMEATARRNGGRVAVNGIARRVTDLLEAGAIEELRAPDPDVADVTVTVTRKTRNGADATVWVATALGRDWLEAAR